MLKFLVTPFLLFSLIALNGCSSAAPRAYDDAVQNVYVGMDKREFDIAMREVHDKTRRKHRRRSEAYQRNGMLYEIVYVRSSNVSDDANTDDEYTPYLFQDGTLIGYGWTAVGGKKTDSADIERAKAGATRVDVKQTTNVDTRPKDYFKCKKDGGDSYFC
ncbi:MAG: hypothetical protein P8J32_06825 [bacterium]|nr:hypothetical protein [bacterium]